MRRQALTLFAVLATIAPGLSLAETKLTGVEAAVLAAHDQRIAATIAGDLAALGAMMTDDLTYTHSSAVTETKAEFLEALKSGKYVYREIKPGERRVRLWGEAAAVSGSAHVVLEPGGKRTEIDLVYTELYVKQGGRWKMALWQSTRLPAAAPAPATK
jgi:ketosteroid isomerase-like protein